MGTGQFHSVTVIVRHGDRTPEDLHARGTSTPPSNSPADLPLISSPDLFL